MTMKKAILGAALLLSPLLAMAGNWPVTVKDISDHPDKYLKVVGVFE